jgi:hypothetical protein
MKFPTSITVIRPQNQYLEEEKSSSSTKNLNKKSDLKSQRTTKNTPHMLPFVLLQSNLRHLRWTTATKVLKIQSGGKARTPTDEREKSSKGKGKEQFSIFMEEKEKIKLRDGAPLMTAWVELGKGNNETIIRNKNLKQSNPTRHLIPKNPLTNLTPTNPHTTLIPTNPNTNFYGAHAAHVSIPT